MNLLFLTGKDGDTVVTNMDHAQVFTFAKTEGGTTIRAWRAGRESSGEMFVIETPAQIRAQLLRLVNPLMGLPHPLLRSTETSP